LGEAAAPQSLKFKGLRMSPSGQNNVSKFLIQKGSAFCEFRVKQMELAVGLLTLISD
jgi:hypothetical protein